MGLSIISLAMYQSICESMRNSLRTAAKAKSAKEIPPVPLQRLALFVDWYTDVILTLTGSHRFEYAAWLGRPDERSVDL